MQFVGNMDLYRIGLALRGQGERYRCATFFEQAGAIFDALGMYHMAAECRVRGQTLREAEERPLGGEDDDDRDAVV